MRPPPPFVSFASAEQLLRSLAHEEALLRGPEVERLIALGLPPVVSVRSLATLFGYSPGFVGAMLRKPERYYRTFSIPKGRGRRTIHAPRVALKAIQTWFGFHLARVTNPPSCVFGFVRGRSAFGAASVHCGADWVYCLDIEDFFPSTPERKVRDSLIVLGYEPHAAEVVARLSCYSGGLAQGSPASPVLSNIVFGSVDEQLVGVGALLNARYTRYADDMVFSGVGTFPDELRDSVSGVVRTAGWRLAQQKVRLLRKPQRLKVHGLLVNGDLPRLTKGYRNRIRAYRHLLESGRISSADLPRVRGHLAFASSIEKAEPMRGKSD